MSIRWAGVALLAGLLAGVLLGRGCVSADHAGQLKGLRDQLTQAQNRATLAQAITQMLPDTIYRDSIVYVPAIPPQEAARPVLVQRKLKNDTLARRRLEAAPIVMGIEKAGPLLNIQRIEPNGAVAQATHPAELMYINFRMDHAGNVVYDARELKRFRRRRFWHTAWQYTKGGLIGAGVVFAGVGLAEK